MNSRANVIYFHEPRYVARLNRKIATHWAIAFHGRVHARFSDSSPPGGTSGSLLPVLPIYSGTPPPEVKDADGKVHKPPESRPSGGTLEAQSRAPHKDRAAPQGIYPILLGGIERGR